MLRNEHLVVISINTLPQAS